MGPPKPQEGDTVAFVLNTDPPSVLADVARVETVDDPRAAVFDRPLHDPNLVELPTLAKMLDLEREATNAWYFEGDDAIKLELSLDECRFWCAPESRFGHNTMASARTLLRFDGRCDGCDRNIDLTGVSARNDVHVHTVDPYSRIEPEPTDSAGRDWPAVMCNRCRTQMDDEGHVRFVDFKFAQNPPCPACGMRRTSQTFYGMPSDFMTSSHGGTPADVARHLRNGVAASVTTAGSDRANVSVPVRSVRRMNDTRKLRAAKQTRRDIRRTRKRRHTKADDDILVTTVRRTLAKHPAALLGIASCFISWATPEPFAWVKGGPRESKALEEFVNGLAGRRLRETTALLAVFAELLVEDESLRERCRSEVAARHDLLPKWLIGLPRVEVLRVLRRTELLGDGDELLIGLRFADATELTVIAFVDHNELSGVTEIGVIRQPLDRVLAGPIQRANPDTRFEEMEPADARTRLEYGLRFGALLSRSDECRLAQPFLRWVITLLPEGGHPYMGPSTDCRAASELLDGFFASSAGAPFGDVDYRDFLDQLCETGCGDPSRWSVRRISDILRDPFHDDGVPLEIAVDAPALLRAFIPFVHADSGIRQELTDDAITVIDEMSLDYKRRLVAEATKVGGDYS